MRATFARKMKRTHYQQQVEINGEQYFYCLCVGGHLFERSLVGEQIIRGKENGK